MIMNKSCEQAEKQTRILYTLYLAVWPIENSQVPGTAQPETNINRVTSEPELVFYTG